MPIAMAVMAELTAGRLTHDRSLAKVAVVGLGMKTAAGIAGRMFAAVTVAVFDEIGKAGLIVDMIVQSVPQGGRAEISFTASATDQQQAVEVAQAIAAASSGGTLYPQTANGPWETPSIARAHEAERTTACRRQHPTPSRAFGVANHCIQTVTNSFFSPLSGDSQDAAIAARLRHSFKRGANRGWPGDSLRLASTRFVSLRKCESPPHANWLDHR